MSDDRQEVLEQLSFFFNHIPFNVYVGMKLEEIKVGFVRMSVPYRPELVGDARRPAIHGGVISALLDTVGGASVFTKGELNDKMSTVDLRVDFLRPGETETIFAESNVIRFGNRVAVTDMIAYHEGRRDEPIATGKGVYNVRRAESS